MSCDEKVTEIRQKLLDVPDRVMRASDLRGRLDYDSVDIEDVRDDLRAAHNAMDEAWRSLCEATP